MNDHFLAFSIFFFFFTFFVNNHPNMQGSTNSYIDIICFELNKSLLSMWYKMNTHI